MSGVSASMIEQALLAGKLTATVELGNGEHVTVRFQGWCPGAGNRIVPLHLADRVWVRTPRRDRIGVVPLTGPNAGRLVEDRHADPLRVWAAGYVLDAALGRGGTDDILMSVRCLRCDAPLYDAESIRRGVGPDCYGSVTSSSHAARNAGFEWPTAIAEPTAEELNAPDPLIMIRLVGDVLEVDFGGYDPHMLATFKRAVANYKTRRFDHARSVWEITGMGRADARRLRDLISDGTMTATTAATEFIADRAG